MPVEYDDNDWQLALLVRKRCDLLRSFSGRCESGDLGRYSLALESLSLEHKDSLKDWLRCVNRKYPDTPEFLAAPG